MGWKVTNKEETTGSAIVGMFSLGAISPTYEVTIENEETHEEKVTLISNDDQLDEHIRNGNLRDP